MNDDGHDDFPVQDSELIFIFNLCIVIKGPLSYKQNHPVVGPAPWNIGAKVLCLHSNSNLINFRMWHHIQKKFQSELRVNFYVSMNLSAHPSCPTSVGQHMMNLTTVGQYVKNIKWQSLFLLFRWILMGMMIFQFKTQSLFSDLIYAMWLKVHCYDVHRHIQYKAQKQHRGDKTLSSEQLPEYGNSSVLFECLMLDVMSYK